MAETVWMRCSACRVEIGFGAPYWACSVSTCNRSRTRLVFCSVPCWDSHVADAHHRDAWAVESRAPSRAAWEQERRAEESRPAAAAPAPARAPAQAAPVRHVVAPVAPVAPAPAPGPTLASGVEREILIVVSKLKKYIKDRSGMNSSDAVADVLSDHVRAICDDAIRAAAQDGRKTVLDRDVPRLRR